MAKYNIEGYEEENNEEKTEEYIELEERMLWAIEHAAQVKEEKKEVKMTKKQRRNQVLE